MNAFAFCRRQLALVAVVCLLLCELGHVQAAEPSGFTQGNARYAAGDFAGASKAYEEAVARGDFRANVFYNLADAYYRQGDRGRAILNYRRALLLEPAHSEAASNLAFLAGGRPAEGKDARIAWVWETAPWASALCGWLGLAGLLLLLAGGGRRALGLGLAVGGFGLCALGAGLIWFFDHGASNVARAVVLAEATPARYSPADSAKVVTSLPAGAEVRVLSEQGAWVYALLADGTTHAWLAADKIAPLVPGR